MFGMAAFWECTLLTQANAAAVRQKGW